MMYNFTNMASFSSLTKATLVLFKYADTSIICFLWYIFHTYLKFSYYFYKARLEMENDLITTQFAPHCTVEQQIPQSFQGPLRPQNPRPIS